MIENIAIQRFRGIKECNIEDLKRFNVFLGYNNCGKSSVLDALFLFTGASNPARNININQIRNYFATDEDALKLNFYGLDVNKNITLTGKYKDIIRQLEISYWEKTAQTINLAKDKEAEGYGEQQKDFGLDMRVGINHAGKKETITSGIAFHSDSKQEATLKNTNHEEELKSWYITPANPYLKTIELFSIIMENKQEQFVVKILQKIEPSIADIVLIDHTIMVDIGLPKRVPIQVLGDGIRKLLSIIVCIYHSQNGIILIDEVDNGLHYKSMPVMWKAIIHAAQEFNVQVFVTTHNIDSLRALNSVLEEDEYEEAQDEMRAYTLRKDNEAMLHAIKSTYKQFNHLIDQEIELR